MRRMIHKRHEEKKQKRNQAILGFVLIFVMFSSVLGYAFINFSYDNTEEIGSENQNSIEYNGFVFTEQNGFWILNLNSKSFIFRNNPNNIPEINSSGLNFLGDYYERPLYISSISIDAESEIRSNLAQFANRTKSACLENEECDENLEIKTCEDNFIIIKEGEESISQEMNCVFIQGKKEDLVKLADSFLFELLGING